MHLLDGMIKIVVLVTHQLYGMQEMMLLISIRIIKIILWMHYGQV